jgi:hypothetical protein
LQGPGAMFDCIKKYALVPSARIGQVIERTRESSPRIYSYLPVRQIRTNSRRTCHCNVLKVTLIMYHVFMLVGKHSSF